MNRVLITIDGVERDFTERFMSMNDALFARICEATRKTGRPVPSSYRVLVEYGPIQLSPAERAAIEYEAHCEVMRKAMSY